MVHVPQLSEGVKSIASCRLSRKKKEECANHGQNQKKNK